MTEHDLDQSDRAQRTLDEYMAGHANDAPYRIAQTYAWFGDSDQAFGWLAKAIRVRSSGIDNLNRDPLLRDLRRGSRFGAVLQQIGLPPSAPDARAASASVPAAPRGERKP